MAKLLGRCECQIDPKGRVSFPSAFRRAVGGAGAPAGESPSAGETPSAALVLLQWQETHLDLLPQATWEAIERKLVEHRRASADGGAYLRGIAAQAVEVEPDDHGRIRIPPWLREQAGLESSALFVGAVDRIEVWNPERFAVAMRGRPADADFAARIFG